MAAQASKIPGLFPECLASLIRQALDSMLHAAAIAFGGVYLFLSIWDVVRAGREFHHVDFGAGAVAIMGAWGTLWLVLRKMKTNAAAAAEGQG